MWFSRGLPLVAAAVVVACSSSGNFFPPDGSGGSSEGGDASGGGDASTGGNSSVGGSTAIGGGTPVDCSGAWEESSEVVLAEPGVPASYQSPAITADELSLFFLRQEGSSRDIAVATRPSTDVPFGAPVVIEELAGVCSGTPTLDVTDDGLNLVVSCYGGGDCVQNDCPLFQATRSSLDAPFDPPVMVHTSMGISPSVSGDGLRVYTSPREPFGGGELLVASRLSLDAPFGPAVSMPGTSWSDAVRAADLSDDTTTLVGASGTTGFELVETQRASKSDVFPAPSPIILSDGDLGYGAPVLSADCRSVYAVAVPSGPFVTEQQIRVVHRQ